MKAYVINSEARTITEAVYNGPYTEICRLGGFELFATVPVNEEGDVVYVDDNGLLTASEETSWFALDGGDALAGDGVVLGLDFETGETVGAKIELEDLKQRIQFGIPAGLGGPLFIVIATEEGEAA